MFNLLKKQSSQYLSGITRNLYSKSKIWPEDWSGELRCKVEAYWKPVLNAQHAVSTQGEVPPDKQKYYVLSMFPYPSGSLHMGHVRVYTISDAMARYHRLRGKHVIHPMGWDAFGLPAENAAIERGELPDVWTESNISSMRKQMKEMCYSLDWGREYATCHPDYYKWTQYLFLKMYEHGLVYRREGAVNWDPVDQTVLADEQIDENGCSWRSGVPAERRFLQQWYIRATAYSKSLYDGLQEVDPDLWKDIISLQQNWIGPCTGMRFEFPVVCRGQSLESSLSVFTESPQCVYGVSHVLLSPLHYLNNPEYYRDAEGSQEREVVELYLQATNPFTKQNVPVFVHKTLDFGPHLDCHLGIPSVNQEDLTFALANNLTYRHVLNEDKNMLQNSADLTGLSTQDAFDVMSKQASELGCGGHMTSARARDWLISRQRYWGTPIPMVHCPRYGTLPVKFEDLPVVLPAVKQFTGKGSSPLSGAEDWLKVKCYKCDCDGYATRETDTMDTFVDSSWYFLRYLDPHNTQAPFSKEAAHRDMPVDLYIGGKEHAIMHLYYARLFSHFLHDLGLTPTREPFVNLLTQGMVMGRSYRVKDTGKYIRPDQVDSSGKTPVEAGTGAALITEWEKMSKSKHNGVHPQEVLETYGTDATRLAILSAVAPKSDRNWSNDVFVGLYRWQGRIWTLVTELRKQRSKPLDCDYTEQQVQAFEEEVFESRNYFLKEINHHLEDSFLLSTAISRLQGLSNALKKIPSPVACRSSEYERALCDLVVMLAPFTPMYCSELWEGLRTMENKLTERQWDSGVFNQAWPTLDPSYKIKIKIKLNDKDGYTVQYPNPLSDLQTLTQTEALELAQTDAPQFDELLQGHQPQTVQVSLVPGVRAEVNFKVKELEVKRKSEKKRKGKDKAENVGS